jgi:hypothetical protein
MGLGLSGSTKGAWSFQNTGDSSQVNSRCDKHAFDSRRVLFFFSLGFDWRGELSFTFTYMDCGFVFA